MLEYKLKKPDLSKISKERLEFLDKNYINIWVENKLMKYSDKKYLFWDKIKFLELPKNIESSEELWYLIKKDRFWFFTPIKTKNWEFFKLCNLEFLKELLHKLDLWLWWHFLWIDFNKPERKIFLQNWITEEAISSSQIEWALTTSKVAREMIWKWKKPITLDEKMIMNNYNAMKFVNEDFKNEKLTLNWLLEIQSILTKEILDFPNQVWRFRKDEDEIVIQDFNWEIFHTPPSEKMLNEELEKLIKYANDEDWVFTHPFIKATILHFWIWYLHPFCDWNWRTARIIFYWYLLKKWYWGFSYIPISKVIKKSKTQYWKAYLYSEQDDNDLTYFVSYIANKTSQSFDEFQDYILKKKKEQKDFYKDLAYLWLNERQNKLLIYFLKNWKSYTNNSIHKNYYWIAINTSKNDLEKLLEKWFLTKKKQWKFVNYFAVENLEKLI